jgi:hypothetical protein
MAISVSCACGKTLKVKDCLAGKAVKCPGCHKPIRIPGGPAGKAPADAASSEIDKAKEKEALLRFEAAQRRKLDSAEAEAAYRQEQNKLIESYDQLAGKSGKEKGKKRELAGEKKRKATFFMKIGDAVAVVLGMLLVRYLMLAIVLGAGAVGSVYLVRYVMGYMQTETAATTKPKDERIKECYKKFDDAFAAKNWSAARDALENVIRADPNKVINREYKTRLEKLEEATRK